MDIIERIGSRAHRILKPLANYRAIDEGGVGLANGLSETIVLHNNERVLGIYENPAHGQQKTVVVTTRGVHVVVGGNYQALAYSQIDHVETPRSGEKHSFGELVVTCRSGDNVIIPIEGGQGRLRDAWEFLRFLNRVVADIHS